MNRQGPAVDVGHVGPQHERRLLLAGDVLQQSRVSWRQLDRVGTGGDDRGDGATHVLDATEEARLVEEAVIDRHVEAAAVGGEEPMEAWYDAHAVPTRPGGRCPTVR